MQSGSSFLRFGLLLWAFGLGACGGEAPPQPKVPSPEEVRDFYGLGNGSCWRYRFSSQGATLFATASVTGPNSNVIAGESVFLRSFILDAGGRPDQEYFDTEENGEVVLRRYDTSNSENQRVTYRYDASAPVFARFDYDAAGALRLRDDRLVTEVTPSGGGLERHVLTVLPGESVQTPEGAADSVRLEYRRTRGQSSPEVALYQLAPNKGIARFVDFDGTTYQVCAQRVCDSQGNCTGAASCDALDCPR